ncbi:imelysin family protein [Rhodovibrionaceae bacterium A322]
MKKLMLASTAGLVMAYAASGALAATDKAAVLNTYADIAEAKFEDSLTTAKALQASIESFLAQPTEDNLAAARAAWLVARAPYQQTEVYRFGNAIVDDWEGKVNAWPLDEGLIDYVDPGAYGEESDENAFYTANVVANKTVTVGGQTIDASKITPELLADALHEVDEVEANVATGYHAIEFLLWGQDLNGTGPGAGKRPATDYDQANCTNGNCDRRAEYLSAVTELLVRDVTWMTAQWKQDGAARVALSENGADGGLSIILTGMGSLSYGELAGERTKLGLMLHDPEEEHDCFSDNTHNSHYYDVVGISNVYNGRYQRIDGSTVEGPSLSDLVKETDPALDKEMSAKLDKTVQAGAAMVQRAENVESYDQMIGEGNEKGNAVVQSFVDALTDQTKSIERVVTKLNLNTIEFEGSDSLDNPSAVFN